MDAEVVVVGHVGCDLVLLVDEEPRAGGTTAVRARKEMLGGKGANQALGLTQLGWRSAVIGAVGDDPAGAWLLSAAAADGIAVEGIAVRPAETTSLIVSVVDGGGSWRYLEDRPDGSYVRVSDVRRCSAMIGSARAVIIQLQERADAVLEAARTARAAGAMVVVDGAANGDDPDQVYASADVVRADHHEAALISGHPIDGVSSAVAAGRRLLDLGPRVVVLGLDDSNAVIWAEGAAVVAHADGPVTDTTGGGDAMVAGLVTGLLRGDDPPGAACLGAAAAASVVRRLGGRPDLDPSDVSRQADLLRARTRRY